MSNLFPQPTEEERRMAAEACPWKGEVSVTATLSTMARRSD
ncbi:MAG: hypothetical protein OZSIB_3691 [Candidatus Ozemobacter sibiricus]|uniref:Uncharacterized protein n=1 Tax=Candidatus Ozemobacter sibiricus TaxID=2268124 RepID=A0A367ZF43_9BACT|nr:MAG: hypothetical protein OZSIB_3691 [Candidatus Ozemobacter sibiricus]